MPAGGLTLAMKSPIKSVLKVNGNLKGF